MQIALDYVKQLIDNSITGKRSGLNKMKPFEECLDIIEEQPHAHHVTLNEYVDADVANGIIRGICSSYALGDEKSMIIFAKSLAIQVTTQMIVRAEEMSKKSINPLED